MFEDVLRRCMCVCTSEQCANQTKKMITLNFVCMLASVCFSRLENLETLTLETVGVYFQFLATYHSINVYTPPHICLV